MIIRQTIARFAAYQRTVHELQSLSNRELRHLGINRSETKTVARGASL